MKFLRTLTGGFVLQCSGLILGIATPDSGIGFFVFCALSFLGYALIPDK